MFHKTRLFTPGPTPLLPASQFAMAAADLHHRTPEFRALYLRVLANLKFFIGSRNDVVVLAASGTGAMEAAVSNLTNPGEKVLVLSAGKFGERWTSLAKAFHCEARTIAASYGQTFDLEEVKGALAEAPRVLFMQATETSTGVRHDVSAIARLLKGSETLLVVDAITGLGTTVLQVDEDGIDIIIGGSQKALMIPPGLAYLAVSERAWQRMETSKQPRYYFDLRKERKSAAKGESAYTTAVALIAAMDAALLYLAAQAEGDVARGREQLVASAELCAASMREAIVAMGLELFATSPSAAVTAVKAPEGISATEIVKTFKREFGGVISDGQGEMKGELFRIAHIGYLDYLDCVGIVAGLEQVLLKLRPGSFELGGGLLAAQKVVSTGCVGRTGWRRTMKVVVAEKIADAAMELLNGIAGLTVVTPEQFKFDADMAHSDADALIVRSAVQANGELMARAPKLRVIGRAGVGVDNVDVEVATRRGILVMNTPGATATSVAELTFGLMLAMARHIPRADYSTRAGKWEKKDLQGTEVAGKTLGIVGLGRIGMEVARRAIAFSMQVVGCDPYISPARAQELGIRLCSLDELYAAADYISLHVGLTHQTTHMINYSSLAKMKDGVRIVNCARGELIHEAALASAMSSGKVAAAALDVFTAEPPTGSPLLALPNLVATPHLGASTREGQDATGVQMARQICDFLRDGVAQNAVNMPSLSDLEYQQVRPYVELATRLGTFMAQIFPSNLAEIEIGYEGEISNLRTELVRNAAVAAVLQYGSEDAVNLINAQNIAQSRGVVVREIRTAPNAKVSVVGLRLNGPGAALACRGTLVHGDSARLVELKGIEIESRLEGNFVVIENEDAPGVVGAIGTTLARHGINIARLSLGREALAREAGRALAIVEIDAALPLEVLSEVRQLKAVHSATSVKV